MWNEDLSEPIMIALRDSSSSGYSDATTSSESSKENGDNDNDTTGFSPKSCFDETGFFSCSGSGSNDHHMLSLEFPHVLPLGDTAAAASLLGHMRTKSIERPFPPRAEMSVDENKKSVKNSNSNRVSSADNTSDEDTDAEAVTAAAMGSRGGTHNKDLLRDVSIASFSSFRSAGCTLSNMHRIASFNAFESPAIYEQHGSSSNHNQIEKVADRQFRTLHREQRKAVAMTADFQELRLKFAYEAIAVLLSREVKRKGASATSVK
jgi:hypothetical protein